MPILASLLGPLSRLRRALLPNSRLRREMFGAIYRTNDWGDEESASGSGSNLEQTAVVRRELPRLLQRIGAHTIVDAPCGDYNWMSQTTLGVDQYIGVDLVPELVQHNQARFGSERVRFQQADLIHDALPSGDVVFCRDCLVHLSFGDALAALRNMRASGARYLLTTTFTRHPANGDIRTGGWRPLNLQLAPFRFPQPAELLIEQCTEGDGEYADKSLGLWRFDELPL